MAKEDKKSCVACASHTGHRIWEHRTGNLCGKGWLRGLALTDGEVGGGVQWLETAEECGSHAGWGTHSTRAPPFAEERSCMDLVSLFSPLGSLQARAAKELCLGCSPQALSGPCCIWLQQLCVGKAALSLQAFSWKSIKPQAALSRKENCKEREWWDSVDGDVQQWEREEQWFVSLIYWFSEQGLFAISMGQWWSSRGAEVSEPSSDSLEVPVSQLLTFLPCQVDWTPGVLFFALLLFASGKWNFIAWI